MVYVKKEFKNEQQVPHTYVHKISRRRPAESQEDMYRCSFQQCCDTQSHKCRCEPSTHQYLRSYKQHTHSLWCSQQLTAIYGWILLVFSPQRCSAPDSTANMPVAMTNMLLTHGSGVHNIKSLMHTSMLLIYTHRADWHPILLGFAKSV